MNILILGGGGREHSLAWAVAQNPKCDRLLGGPCVIKCRHCQGFAGLRITGYCRRRGGS